MTTLKDIAKEAGVSTATVSQVLNDKENPFISQATKEGILQAAERLHYIPNRVARDLARGSTMVLGVIIPRAADLFFPEVVEGIEEAASTKGYDIVLSYSAGNFQKERKHIQLLLERKVDGLLVAPLENNQNIPIFRELLERKFPFVFIDRYLPEVKTDFVVSDLKDGACEAVSYLIRLGRTKIVHITKDSNISTVRDVLEGYKMALMKNGLKINQELVKAVNSEISSNSYEAGYNGMKKLLEKRVDFTAVFCIDDNLAVGALKTLKEAKLKVPQDISVVGMDNLAVSSYLTSPLTSVAQNKIQMGKLASEILIKRIENPENKKKQIFLKTNLILRESTNEKEI